jgi:hypothetical protein
MMALVSSVPIDTSPYVPTDLALDVFLLGTWLLRLNRVGLAILDRR